MKRIVRVAMGIAASTIVFGAIAHFSSRLYWVTLRETHCAAELVGIMDPAGSLGGQVAGFNYQRGPAWVYPVGQVLGAAVAYGPGLVVALLLMDRVGRGSWRVSLCGKCGARIRAVVAARVDGAPTSPEEPGKSVARDNARCGMCGGEF